MLKHSKKMTAPLCQTFNMFLWINKHFYLQFFPFKDIKPNHRNVITVTKAWFTSSYDRTWICPHFRKDTESTRCINTFLRRIISSRFFSFLPHPKKQAGRWVSDMKCLGVCACAFPSRAFSVPKNPK